MNPEMLMALVAQVAGPMLKNIPTDDLIAGRDMAVALVEGELVRRELEARTQNMIEPGDAIHG